jgi:hypothetical protein
VACEAPKPSDCHECKQPGWLSGLGYGEWEWVEKENPYEGCAICEGGNWVEMPNIPCAEQSECPPDDCYCYVDGGKCESCVDAEEPGEPNGCGSGITSGYPDDPCANPIIDPFGSAPSCDFNLACNGHDNCYGGVCGGTKAVCDGKFEIDMLQVCAQYDVGSDERINCRKHAKHLYTAVKLGGGAAFRSGQKNICCD